MLYIFSTASKRRETFFLFEGTEKYFYSVYCFQLKRLMWRQILSDLNFIFLPVYTQNEQTIKINAIIP